MLARGEGFLLIGVMLVLSFVFQVQLKLYSGEVLGIVARENMGWIDRLIALATSLMAWRPAVILLLAGALFATWFLAIMRLDLSVALPLASLSIAANALAAGVMLAEPLSWMRVGGILIIAVGVILVMNG